MNKKYISLASFFIMLLTLGVNMAFAQSLSMPLTDLNTTPPDTDISLNLLHKIIGDPFSDVGHPVMSNAFFVVNSGVMMFASIVFLYTVLSGILKTAEDGEFLGKRWSSQWVVFRFMAGVIFIFPLANGFSVSQRAVYWVGEQGVGFANLTLEKTVDGLVNNQGSMVAVRLAEEGSIKNTLRQILKSEVCTQDMASKYGSAFGLSVINAAGDGGGARFIWGPFIDTTSFSDPVTGAGVDTTSFPPSVCGTMEIPSLYLMTNSDGAIGRAAGQFGSLFSDGWSGSREANKQIQTVQAMFLKNAAEKLRPLAQRLAVREGPVVSESEIVSRINTVAAEYYDGVAAAVKQQVQVQNRTMTAAMSQDAKETGWIGFGAWYYQMARINSELNNMARLVPSFTDVAIADESGLGGMDPALSVRIDSAIINDSVNNISVQDRTGQIVSAAGGLSGMINDGTNSVSNSVGQSIATFFSVDPTSPTHALVQLKNVGDYMIGSVEGILFAGFIADKVGLGGKVDAVKDVASKAASATGASKLFSWLGKVLNSDGGREAKSFASYLAFFAVVGLMGFALVLAFWLPISGFIIWMGSVLGWLISFIEMLVAAPIWLAAHMHPDGEGMSSDHSRQGYMLLAEVFCRPFLMVIGLIISMLMIDPFLRFASSIFFNAFDTTTADSITGIVSILALVFIYCGFCLGLVNRCFAIIHIFPNSVLRWVGAHASGHDQGNQADSDIHNTVLAYFNRGQDVARRASGASKNSLKPKQQIAQKHGEGDNNML